VAQVGRISGPLLFENLERNGKDLAFRNTLDETQLLYLEVTNGFIGVNKNSPGYQLDIAGTTRTKDIIVDTSAEIADFSIDTSNINNLTGDINLNAAGIINLSNFETENLHITDNVISSYKTNSNIDLDTNGTGTVELSSSLNVYGDIHATGNITMDGNIVFGDAADDSTTPSDTVTFFSDVNSDILPDLHQTYNLGSSAKRWDEINTVLVNGGTVEATVVDLDGVRPFTLRQGNIIYVAENGNDSNVGDHPNGPFKTIKHALDFADASINGPVTIFVYAGGYEEELPLVVPTNVSIVGEDFRNTFIRPTSADQSKDIFHLNGESTVQNLTITDFYYDSLNDTGYAFRFAPNTVVTTRSPYVQNVTVITKGTTTSASDPRGFASGDAGKGALVDGASVNSASEEASMLFHSVTFITPGVDAVTMTNGVRVEWLNSFTYFANRGLYAVDGVTGHLSTDGSTVKYGAELRSIGSANVYGNYGAVADGADCLMYLIQHNMAYIGVGKYVDNDPSRVIQSQEVTELNSGKIYYQTVDHYGNFRVGDNFLVDQESGETSLVLTEADIDALNGMTITTGGSTTYIDGTRVETGNIRFRDNTISSLTGDINVTSASSTINLQNSTNMQKDLSITGNLSFDGALITVGNEASDTVTFNTEFTQDVIPDISGLYSLGSSTKHWKSAYLSKAEINDIEIQDNQIRSTNSNSDLELRANGTGVVLIPNNDVTVSERLIVSQTMTSNSASATVIINNGYSQISGNHSMSDLDTESLNVDQFAQFEEILIDDNYITTTSSNADLELRASGTGQIRVPNNDVTIINNLSINDLNSDTIVVQNNLTSTEAFASGNLNIRDNFIQTTISNSDLELRANGTGKIFTDSPVQIDNNITVTGNMSFVGNLSGDDILGVTDVNADQFYAERFHTDDQINIWDNNISTVVSNADLELRANGTGKIYVPNNDVQIDNNLTVNGNVTVGNDLTITGDFTADDITLTGTATANEFTTGDIRIFQNVITTSNSNSDLELRANGSGSVIAENFTFEGNDIRTEGDMTLTPGDQNVIINSTGALTLPIGKTIERPVDGSTLTSGQIRFNSDLNIFEGYNGTTWIQLHGVIDEDRDTSVTAELTPGANDNTIRFNVAGTTVVDVDSNRLRANKIVVDNITVDGNLISSSTNTNLNLTGNGTGSVVIENFNIKESTITNTVSNAVTTFENTNNGYVKFAGTYGMVIPVGTNSNRPPSLYTEVGQMRWNTDAARTEIWDGDNWVSVAGTNTGISRAEAEELALGIVLTLG